MGKLTVFLLLFSFNLSINGSDCPCEKFTSSTLPNKGHIPVTIIKKKPIKKIQGIITDPLGKPPSKTYIHLLRVSNDDFDLDSLKAEDIVLACEVGKDGKFCFDRLPKGRYVICASSVYDSNYVANTTFMFVELKPNTKESKDQLNIILEPAT